MVRAVFPGTFDPIHYGHIDIARRAARFFDEVQIAVYDDPPKDVLFTAEERLGQKEDSEYRMYIYRWPKDSHEGKYSKTEFQALWENDDYILALAFPYTGRQHQIRAHACEHGFPLL